MNLSPWICCQLGAREHYAIPRALHQSGQLASFLVDAWVPPRSAIYALPIAQLRDRFHPDLADAPIHAATRSLIGFELKQRLQKTPSWDRMIDRNRWFQRRMLRQLKKLAPRFTKAGDRPIFFTYSYAALDLLHYAKAQGWQTVLGQIDPGLIEEQIVLAEQKKHPALSPTWQPVPPTYWEQWQQECSIADLIVVNSEWSRQSLQQAGIAADKIELVPLVYQPHAAAQTFDRRYPQQFSFDRPLRVLFLGQVILRKGIAAVIEAAEQLKHQPIEFWIVGSSEVVAPSSLSNIRWIRSVPRSATAEYYQRADLFLFPTLSDGFGLTQLEAQAWNLPLIVSKFCGEVVVEGVNGKILPEVTGSAIAEVLEAFLEDPRQLARLSQGCSQHSRLGLPQLCDRLNAIVQPVEAFI